MVRSIGFKWDEEIGRIGMDDSGQEFDVKRLKHYWSHSFRLKIKWSIDHMIYDIVGGINGNINVRIYLVSLKHFWTF